MDTRSDTQKLKEEHAQRAEKLTMKASMMGAATKDPVLHRMVERMKAKMVRVHELVNTDENFGECYHQCKLIEDAYNRISKRYRSVSRKEHP